MNKQRVEAVPARPQESTPLRKVTAAYRRVMEKQGQMRLPETDVPKKEKTNA